MVWLCGWRVWTMDPTRVPATVGTEDGVRRLGRGRVFCEAEDQVRDEYLDQGRRQ